MPPFPLLSSNGKFSVSDTRRRIKKHGNAVLLGALSVGAVRPQTPTQETFREKFLGTSKASLR